MIFPLSAAVDIGLGLYGVQLDVVDVIYGPDADGVDIQGSDAASYSILAVVDTSDKRKLQHLFGTSVSDGDIAIYTKRPLSFVDIHSPSQGQPQSFVTYKGWQYRILGQSDFTDAASSYIYLGSRHVTQDRI